MLYVRLYMLRYVMSSLTVTKLMYIADAYRTLQFACHNKHEQFFIVPLMQNNKI